MQMTKTVEEYPLVSVGITTCNRPITLRQALNSVVGQTYKNIEIIVSDDCSPSLETESVVREFIQKDSRIKYFRHPENKGVTFNYNFIVNKASGKYFMWLCDDDWIDPPYIAMCLKTLLENPDHFLACGKTRFYWGDRLAYEVREINVLEETGISRVLSFYNQVLGTGNPPQYGVTSRELLINMPLKNIMGLDCILTANFAFYGKIRTLENVCIHRRLGGISESLKKLAINLKLSSFVIKHPFLSLWMNIFKDIAWVSPTYKPLRRLARFWLASKLSAQILSNISKYIILYRMRFPVNRRGDLGETIQI